MNKQQAAWVAALIEGEGYIGVRKSSGTVDGLRAEIAVKMTDEDVLQTLVAVTGLGKVNGPYTVLDGKHKDIWRWQVTAKHDLQILLARIKPLMHSRRRQAITVVQQRFLRLNNI